MIIEILFSEVCGLYGDFQNPKYLEATLPDAQFIYTELTQTPYFVNHDVDMLRMGPYPYPLKRRILSDAGHLSNAACAEFLPKLYRSGCRRFLLAHLSRENNTPDVAYQTACIAEKGLD